MLDIASLHIGDIVRIVSAWKESADGYYRNDDNEDMDVYLGTNMTVKNVVVNDDSPDESYAIMEEDTYWCWFPEMIECVVSSIEDAEDIEPISNVDAFFVGGW